MTNAVSRGAGRLLAGVVRGYQLVVSPWLGPSCRYYPSCSSYAVDALQQHGAVRGGGLAFWRLLRCNPWSNGGVDHVPAQGEPMPWSRKSGRGRTLGVVDGGAQSPDAPQDL